MHDLINVYCDESCHLQNDTVSHAMVIGAIWGDKNAIWESSKYFKLLKMKYDLNTAYEFKWTKISSNKIDFYKEVLDHFFANDEIHFRSIIIPDKAKLRHEDFQQTHDEWYYKMFFILVKEIIIPHNAYGIYMDYKDTWSNSRCKKLESILQIKFKDSNRELITNIQPVRSHEVEMIQLCDLLIGAMTYSLRGDYRSPAKRTILDHIEGALSRKITLPTSKFERKFNVFEWSAS